MSIAERPDGSGASPGDEASTSELAVERAARRFELRPLLALLKRMGYAADEIVFESALRSESPTVVEEVRFVKSPTRLVRVTLNLGLLGDSSLLPSYFFEAVERAGDPERLHAFIRFFDHWLLGARVRALYPEDQGRIFRDWGEARASFLRMLGVESPSTLRWLAQLYFPELRVNASRRAFSRPTTAHAFRTGSSPLDGSYVLGRSFEATAEGVVIDLVAEEENDAAGRSWASVVRERLDARLLRVLAPFRLVLMVRLRVLSHASWAHLEGDAPRRGDLGYDRLRGEEASGHTFIVFRGVAGETHAG